MSAPIVVSPNRLARGDVVTGSSINGFVREPVVVLHNAHRESGGSGMGEYPATNAVVLSDGRLLVYNEWLQQSNLPSHFTISGKATFAKDGRLVLFNG